MAAAPRSIEVKVRVEVDEEALNKLEAAQSRFNAALQELQNAIREVQMATYSLADSVATQDAPPAEPPVDTPA